MELTTKAVGKATFIVAIGTGLGTLLGFIREVIIAKLFGTSLQLDAFLLVLIVPFLSFSLFLSALRTAVIPLLIENKRRWDIPCTLFLVCIVISGCLLFIVGPLFIFWTKKVGLPPEFIQIFSKLVWIVYPLMFFSSGVSILIAVLHSYKLFSLPAFLTPISNIVIITFLILGKKWGIWALGWGFSLSFLVQLIFLLPGVFSLKPKLEINFSSSLLKYIFKVTWFILLGSALGQVNLAVGRAFSITIGEGVVSGLNYAYKVMNLPFAVFSYSLATVLFPVMSEFIVNKETTKIINTLNLSFKTILIIMLPASVWLILLRLPIVSLLFERGAFNHQSTMITKEALLFYSLGIVPLSFCAVLFNFFFAGRNYSSPVKATIVGIIANWIFCRWFSGLTISWRGVALAYSLSALFSMLILLKGAPHFWESRDWSLFLLKLSISVIILGATSYILFNCLQGIPLYLNLGAVGTVSGAVYILLLYIFKVKELALFRELLSKR